MQSSLAGVVRPTPARSLPRPYLLGLLLLALVLVPLLSLPSGAAAMQKGLMDETLARSNDPALRARFWRAARSAKVRFVRTYIEWDGKTLYPLPQEIFAIRRMAAAAARNGVKTLFVGFTGRLGDGRDDARQIDLNAYQAMVYTSAFTLRDLPVKIVWSPINEPNLSVLLPQKHGPEVWRKMQNLAYDTIKSVNPKDQVYAGELAPYARNRRRATDPGTFMRKALGLNSHWKPDKGTKAADYAIKADGITMHPYDYKRNPYSPLHSHAKWTIRNLPSTLGLLHRAAREDRLPTDALKHVYATEFAYLAGTSQKISQSRASTYLRRAWRQAKRSKLHGLLWFQLRDPPTGTFKSGLTTRTNHRRKVYKTFLRLR